MGGCEHVFCRMWHSAFDPWCDVALWWCPRCTGIDTRIPNEPEQTEGGTLALVRPATWWVRLTERAGIEFEHDGPLTREQARQFSRALGRADDVAEHMLMRLAGKPQAWQLEPHYEGQVVISRWRGLDWKVALTLLPVTPRKETVCDGCGATITAGVRAWRGSAPPPGMRTPESSSEYRFCTSCIDAMSPTPIGQTRGRGAVLRLVAGGEA